MLQSTTYTDGKHALQHPSVNTRLSANQNVVVESSLGKLPIDIGRR